MAFVRRRVIGATAVSSIEQFEVYRIQSFETSISFESYKFILTASHKKERLSSFYRGLTTGD
jgi:hypothetical protein